MEFGEALRSLGSSFLMNPFVVGSPLGFRSTVASLPEPPVAGFFPLCRDRRLSLGDQSRVAEPCEPGNFQPRVQSADQRIFRNGLTMVVSSLDPNHLAKFLSPLFRMFPMKFQDVRSRKTLPSVERKLKRKGTRFILSIRGWIG